jgi:O-succinylbenzoic acid--CoA ligase
MEGIQVDTTPSGTLKILDEKTNFWLETQDLAEVKDERHFIWKGRKDLVINTGGIKVSVDQLEARIGEIFEQMKIGNRFMVFSCPDDLLGEQIMLLIEGKPFLKNIMHSMTVLFDSRLDKYEIPKQVYFIDAFLDTETGKILRKDTEELYLRTCQNQ